MTKFKHIGNEKSIELHITENLHDIAAGCFWSDISHFRNQYCFPLRDNRMFCDIFIWHKDFTGTVIEVKKYRSISEQIYSIGQVLLYAELTKSLLGNYPRLVIASDFIHPMLKAVIKGQKLPIKTLQVDGDIVEYL